MLAPRDRILLAVHLLGGQRNLAREIPTGDRNVRRWAAGEGEPSAEMLAGVRTALERRRGEIEAALGWPSTLLGNSDGDGGDLDLLMFIKRWNGIMVYPESTDPNQIKIAAAAQRLIVAGKLSGRREGEVLFVSPATSARNLNSTG